MHNLAMGQCSKKLRFCVNKQDVGFDYGTSSSVNCKILDCESTSPLGLQSTGLANILDQRVLSVN